MKKKGILIEFSDTNSSATVDASELQKKIKKLDTYLKKIDYKLALYKTQLVEENSPTKKERDLIETGLRVLKVQDKKKTHA